MAKHREGDGRVSRKNVPLVAWIPATCRGGNPVHREITDRQTLTTSSSVATNPHPRRRRKHLQDQNKQWPPRGPTGSSPTGMLMVWHSSWIMAPSSWKTPQPTG